MSIEILPLAGTLGADIHGVDVATIDDATFEAVHQALLDHGVIVLRDQDITPAQQIAFAKRWNDLHTHPYLAGLPEHPEIIEIIKEPDEEGGFGAHWHTDQIFTPAPAMATMLYAKEVPAVGGDTMFASMPTAYEALSDGMKAMLRHVHTFSQYNKTAKRSGKMSGKVTKPSKPAVHPIIRVHPETRRPGLYINEMENLRHLDGMTVEESTPIINYLIRHATKPEFTCRVRWEVGSLAVWDNRQLMHMALNDYPGRRRVMHRITIKGDVPFGLDEAGDLP
ncbi:MAG: TauD/TfdA family dioxygenase [Proteobacteria bacterium]|nr:TauD/TfdA family dioxygenase [Pseudomonadota bacterium]